jgi:hypothetical protein
MVLEEIANTVDEKIPTTVKGLCSFVRRAAKKTSDVKIWSSLSDEAQDYLTACRKAMQEQQEIPRPDDFVDESSNVSGTGEEDDEAPPAKFKVSCNGKNYSIDNVLMQMEQGRLKLPSFQRKFVWPKPTQQNFIRAVLDDIPIIGLTFTLDLKYGNDRYIMDGFQRLSTLKAFKDGEFTLPKGHEYAGVKFDDLPKEVRTHFLWKDIMANEVIADRDVWPYIFRQINRGGNPLKEDEIRRATPWGKDHQQHPVIELFDELAENHSQWLEVFGKNSRYKGFGALVRGVAMHTSYKLFTKKMSPFLDTFCSSLDVLQLDAKNLQERLSLIFSALAEEIGKSSFRNGKTVNAGLCDCMLHAGLLLTADASNFPESEELGTKLKQVKAKLLADPAVVNAITNDTSGRSSVMTRMEAVEKIIEGL